MKNFLTITAKLSLTYKKLGMFVGTLTLSLLLNNVSTAAEMGSEEEDLTFFRIGAGPTSETLYALGTAISASISRPPGTLPCKTLGGVCGVPGLIAVAQSKSGSIENLNDLRAGEVDSALVRADVANQAYQGIGPFIHDGENQNLRIIANMIPVSAHIIVKADSDIMTIEDLKGKRVSIGAKGSGTRLFARSVLQAYGMDIQDIIYRYYRPGPAADAIADGSLNAAIIIGAAPIPAIKSLSSNESLRFVPIDGEGRETLKRIYAHLSDAEISQTTYMSEQSIETVSVNVQWVVNASANIKLIEDITQALWQSETEAFFLRNNPEHNFPERQTAIPKGVIPAHQGAETYYKSSGLM